MGRGRCRSKRRIDGSMTMMVKGVFIGQQRCKDKGYTDGSTKM